MEGENTEIEQSTMDVHLPSKLRVGGSVARSVFHEYDCMPSSSVINLASCYNVREMELVSGLIVMTVITEE